MSLGKIRPKGGPSHFFAKKLYENCHVEKSSPKCWASSLISKKTAQRKQSPKKSKIRQIWSPCCSPATCQLASRTLTGGKRATVAARVTRCVYEKVAQNVAHCIFQKITTYPLPWKK
jgi:hypothetical protein